MEDIQPPEKRKALVVGLGQTGLSCARYLHDKGVEVTVTDSRDLPPMHRTLREELPEVDVHTGGFEQETFLKADFIVVSPGVSLQETAIVQARAEGIEVIGDIELFMREVDAPVVAITGSNGKSTVTALVGDMCWQQGMNSVVAGNIGTPVLDVLRDQEFHPDCFILELSSFQLETVTSLTSKAATILNLSEDHMDRYPGFDEYVAAKIRIFSGDGIAVVNRSDSRLMAALPADKPFISFGCNAPPGAHDYGLSERDGELWLVRGERKILQANQVPLAGRHNLLNVLAAMALAEQVGVEVSVCTDAVRNFQGLPHRMEIVVKKRGVTWINDSKATNVGAAAAALEGLSNSVILIAGGDGKGADFGELTTPIAQHARAVVLIGRDAGKIANVVPDVVPVFEAADMREAVVRARSLAVEGDYVLLAPACASFDMYDNFEERGEDFRNLVHELI
jgi:UDP-N-acetylmuramoylalanine--D-glutamate ligase